MVGDQCAAGKSLTRFADTPWNEESPQWLQIDQDLEADHLARQIFEAVKRLDLTDLFHSYSRRGKKPLRPDLMLAMVLFEKRRGRNKPSQWFQDAKENRALSWLGFGIRPARSCWYEFRDRVARFLDDLNRQVLQQAVAEGATTAERGALDGTSVAANASRRRLINEERLQKRLAQLQIAHEADQQGEPPEHVPGWMAKTPESRVAQQHRYEKAQQHLDELLAANQRRIPSERRPPEKVVISPGDPEAALGLDKERVFRPLYTVQTIRDVDSPFILGYAVYAQPTDAGTLQPMLRRAEQLTGRRLDTLLVDSGYVTGVDLAVCAKEGVTLYGPWKENDFSQATTSRLYSKDDFAWFSKREAYRCPAGQWLELLGCERRIRSGGRAEVLMRYACAPKTCQACRLRSQCTKSKNGARSVRRSEHEDLIQAHREKMATDESKAICKLRGQTIEIVFADFKEHRGLRRFSGRGLQRANAEFALEVLVHNLLALHHSNPPSDRMNQPHENREKLPP